MNAPVPQKKRSEQRAERGRVLARVVGAISAQPQTLLRRAATARPGPACQSWQASETVMVAVWARVSVPCRSVPFRRARVSDT